VFLFCFFKAWNLFGWVHGQCACIAFGLTSCLEATKLKRGWFLFDEMRGWMILRYLDYYNHDVFYCLHFGTSMDAAEDGGARTTCCYMAHSWSFEVTMHCSGKAYKGIFPRIASLPLYTKLTFTCWNCAGQISFLCFSTTLRFDLAASSLAGARYAEMGRHATTKSVDAKHDTSCQNLCEQMVTVLPRELRVLIYEHVLGDVVKCVLQCQDST
jgi:hypothetical protein